MVKENENLNDNLADQIITRTSRIWLDVEGIVRIVKLPGAEETLEDAERNYDAIIKVSGQKRRPIFIDGSLLKSVTRKVRVYYAKNIPKQATAIAPLTKSSFNRVLASFLQPLIKTIYKGDFPFKIFTSEKEAIEWLRGHLD